MLRQALRRLLWIVPILIGVTLTSFALLSYVPDPASDAAALMMLDEERAEEVRRSRFLDLPRFVNEKPVDVVGRVDRALALVTSEGPASEKGRAALVRLGGAALPYLLPRLDALDSALRATVAVALLPVAKRMGIESTEAADPARAVAFWVRYWADRAIDFRPANARRAVRRLASHGTSTREQDVIELDTFALEQILEVLSELTEPRSEARLGGEDRIGAMRRLVAAAAHVTERDDVIPPSATEGDAILCVNRWREWWLVHRADYIAYAGSARFVAMLIDTQYARWAEKVVVLGFSNRDSSISVWQKLRERAKPTLTIVFFALWLAYAAALALSLVGSLSERRYVDRWVGAITLAFAALPTACLAVLVARESQHSVPLAAVVLSAGIVASPLGQARALLADVRRSDFVRQANAFGLPASRIGIGHVLRHAALPLVAMASVEMPTALGGAFVVEHAFGISGLGEETIRAVQTHDIAWLVGLAFITALLVTITSILADLAAGALDPRLSASASYRQ